MTKEDIVSKLEQCGFTLIFQGEGEEREPIDLELTRNEFTMTLHSEAKDETFYEFSRLLKYLVGFGNRDVLQEESKSIRMDCMGYIQLILNSADKGDLEPDYAIYLKSQFLDSFTQCFHFEAVEDVRSIEYGYLLIEAYLNLISERDKCAYFTFRTALFNEAYFERLSFSEFIEKLLENDPDMFNQDVFDSYMVQVETETITVLSISEKYRNKLGKVISFKPSSHLIDFYKQVLKKHLPINEADYVKFTSTSYNYIYEETQNITLHYVFDEIMRDGCLGDEQQAYLQQHSIANLEDGICEN